MLDRIVYDINDETVDNSVKKMKGRPLSKKQIARFLLTGKTKGKRKKAMQR